MSCIYVYSVEKKGQLFITPAITNNLNNNLNLWFYNEIQVTNNSQLFKRLYIYISKRIRERK